MHRFLAVLGTLSALALGSCNDGTGPRPVPSGSLSAVLSGALTGEYEAVGALPPSGRPAATFAAAWAAPGAAGMLLVGGFRAGAADGQDALLLELASFAGPGVYAATGSLTVTASGVPTPGRSFQIAAGEVRVTAFAADRVRGEFSATAVTPSSVLSPPPDTVVLSAGRFDVPIVRP